MTDTLDLFDRIRTIETFSGNLSGQIQSINPFEGTFTVMKNSTTATNGLSAMSGDARATPGAYQVDIANGNGIF